MTSPTSGLAGDVASLQRDREILDRMVADQSLTSDFQPIVELPGGTVAGYKAIAHGPEGTAVATPVGLLQSAKATGHLERLDWMFRCRAFEMALDGGVSKPLRLHITFESETYGSSCPPRLAAVFGRSKRELLVAVDVPVRAYDDPQGLAKGLDENRQIGWLISLDDISERPDAIEALDALRPDVIKIDLSRPGRVAGPGQSPGVAALLAYAARTGTDLMAESVDTTADRGTAEALGAKYARGRTFGVPLPLPAS